MTDFRGRAGSPQLPRKRSTGEVRPWPYLEPVDATSDRWKIERPATKFSCQGGAKLTLAKRSYLHDRQPPPGGDAMTSTLAGADIRGFYTALGIILPECGTSVPQRVGALLRKDPDAHAHADRSPSCSINVENGAWKCWSCGARGGAFDAATALGHDDRAAMDLLVAYGLAPRRRARLRAPIQPSPPHEDDRARAARGAEVATPAACSRRLSRTSPAGSTALQQARVAAGHAPQGAARPVAGRDPQPHCRSAGTAGRLTLPIRTCAGRVAGRPALRPAAHPPAPRCSLCPAPASACSLTPSASRRRLEPAL